MIWKSLINIYILQGVLFIYLFILFIYLFIYSVTVFILFIKSKSVKKNYGVREIIFIKEI